MWLLLRPSAHSRGSLKSWPGTNGRLFFICQVDSQSCGMMEVWNPCTARSFSRTVLRLSLCLLFLQKCGAALWGWAAWNCPSPAWKRRVLAVSKGRFYPFSYLPLLPAPFGLCLSLSQSLVFLPLLAQCILPRVPAAKLNRYYWGKLRKRRGFKFQ